MHARSFLLQIIYTYRLSGFLVLTSLLAAAETDFDSRLRAEWQRQFDAINEECVLRSAESGIPTRRYWEPANEQIYDSQALLHPEDRHALDVVLRRTGALLRALQANGQALEQESEEWTRLCHQAAQVEVALVPGEREWGRRKNKRLVAVSELADPAAIWSLFVQACQLRRRIAFANPILDFDSIIAVSGRRNKVQHCVSPTYGACTQAGGGILLVEGVFSEQPQATLLNQGLRPDNGRWQDQALPPGTWRWPDLHWDGQRLVIAFAPDGPVPEQPAWQIETQRQAATCSFELFSLDLSSRRLQQLTEDAWDDTQPAWLPDGRIVFCSARRACANRCGGSGFSQTLHALDPSSGTIDILSYHDTHEWSPAVLDDGRVVYTRWDYVDRGDCIAHHPWICGPDGRDPRAIHGNYPVNRNARPDMEIDIRPVPESRLLIATAAPHHNQAFGSLVLVDPSIEDDGAMAQVKRFTPEAGFPEVEKDGRLQYATPWPLSADYVLCSYAPWAPGWGTDAPDGHHGLYLVDRFGNTVLLWQDPEFSCFDPIPLRPRPTPPILQGARLDPALVGGDVTGKAAVALLDVYDSSQPWPEHTEITALRVVRIYPKDPLPVDPDACEFDNGKWGQGWMNRPDVGIASESMARGVLGTVPLEADGSAFFVVPTGCTLLFQALDERGQAVQNMMSTTYFHDGEMITCQGCHENRSKTPSVKDSMPLAMQRPPRSIIPEPFSADPIHYPSLVQPVLDKHCVDCHAKNEKTLDLSGEPAAWERKGWGSGSAQWTKSYISLTAGGTTTGRDWKADLGYAFGLSGRGQGRLPSYSTPGTIGARASRLMTLLDQGHHGVELSAEERHRLVLWLDCNSNFYGAYHQVDAQRAGQVVMPKLW